MAPIHPVSPRAFTVLLLSVCAAHFIAAGPVRAQTAYLDQERSARARDALESSDGLTALGGFARAMTLFQHVEDPALEAQFVEDVARRARDPVTRAHAGSVLARRASRTGDVAAAARRHEELGFVPFVRAIGPFANTGGASFGQPIPGADVAQQMQRVGGLERDVGWQTVPLDPHGEMDLLPRLAPIRETRALVAVVVQAKQPGPAALRLGSSGQARVVWNGAELLRVDADRAAALDQNVVGIQLLQGDNLLWIELGFLGGDGNLRLRITKPDGTRQPGLRFSVDDAAFARAAKVRSTIQFTSPLADPVAAARRIRESISSTAPLPESLPALRAAVALEERLHPSDERLKPLALEQLLAAWIHLLQAQPDAKADSASALARLGSVLRLRDTTGARASYDEALLHDPTSLEALLGLAALREAQDDEAEARRLYARAGAAGPHSDLAQRAALDFGRRSGGGLDADLAILERAKIAPTEENVSLAADVLEEHGDVAGALAALSRSALADVTRKNALASGMAAARLPQDPGALDERVVLARRTLEVRPGSHGSAEELAMALVAAGKLGDAKTFAKQRAASFPERAEPLALIARLAMLEGDHQAASQALAAALVFTPQDADLQRQLRSLGSNEDELAVRYGLDPTSFENEPLPTRARELGAHLVATTTAVRFFENGLGRVMTDRIFQVHDARKASALQSFAFPYTQGRENVDILVAERITRDGRREAALRVTDSAPSGKENGAYTDQAARNVTFGTLVDGDLIHLRTRKELTGQQNLFGDFFGTLELVQSVIPVRNFRLVVEAPQGRRLYWGGRHAPQPVISEDGDWRIHDFQVSEVPALEPELGMPPFLEAADFVSVSTYGTWQAMGEWYEALIAPQLVLDDDLKRIAREISASSKTNEEIVRRTYEYVVTATRYVGIELGIHGWKPYPVSEVHRRKFGDCKDKASLLVSLLREAGVPANVALVRTANIGVIEPNPPSMWTFNHAIAYVPSLDLFLDGTAEQSGWRDLPAMDQGALTLIIGKHGDQEESELRTIPVLPAESNLNVSEYALSLGTDGALLVRGVERFRGTHNAEQRREFADPATRREHLEKHLAGIMPGTSVSFVDVSDLALAAEETSYRFEATLPERAVREQSGSLTMALSLYPHDLVGNYAERSTRKTSIFLDRPWRTRNVMRYIVPPELMVTDLPSGGTVKTPHLSFTQIITRTSDGFIVDEDTAVLSRRIPVEDYPAFREAALRADALMKRKIRFAPRKPS